MLFQYRYQFFSREAHRPPGCVIKHQKVFYLPIALQQFQSLEPGAYTRQTRGSGTAHQKRGDNYGGQERHTGQRICIDASCAAACVGIQPATPVKGVWLGAIVVRVGCMADVLPIVNTEAVDVCELEVCYAYDCHCNANLQGSHTELQSRRGLTGLIYKPVDNHYTDMDPNGSKHQEWQFEHLLRYGRRVRAQGVVPEGTISGPRQLSMLGSALLRRGSRTGLELVN